MLRKFGNDWLRDVGRKRLESHTLLLDALFHLQPQGVRNIIRAIRDFQGTKVLVSCTDRTHLETVLKLSLCFADLAIIGSAPLWVYCGSTAPVEFNSESVGSGRWWNAASGVLKNMSDLLVRERQALDEGAVTFLPVLGESPHRWSHPDLELPELPCPFSKHQETHTKLDIQMEALYGLCSERLAAEKLGAMHLNPSSFLNPVLGDFAVARVTQAGGWMRHLTEMSIPDVTRLSVSEILGLRRERPDLFLQFSRTILNVLQANGQGSQIAGSGGGDLRLSAADFGRELDYLSAKKASAKTDHLERSTFVLAKGGLRGGISPAVEFLIEGGTFHDFVNLITNTGDLRLKIRKDSLFAAVACSDRM